MRDNASPEQQILVTSMDFHQDATNYMQKNNKITQPSPEILVICYFREFGDAGTYPTKTT